MKKLVYHRVPHNLTEHQKAEDVRICKEKLKLFDDGGHHHQIITDNFWTFQCIKNIKYGSLKMTPNQQW